MHNNRRGRCRCVVTCNSGYITSLDMGYNLWCYEYLNWWNRNYPHVNPWWCTYFKDSFHYWNALVLVLSYKCNRSWYFWNRLDGRTCLALLAMECLLGISNHFKTVYRKWRRTLAFGKELLEKWSSLSENRYLLSKL